ncbi:hypothetical protein FRB98_003143 [Tulasnella sp. 332]|nr:hypothetical protein FRB98_003143 [Tulasnella sp. 332]
MADHPSDHTRAANPDPDPAPVSASATTSPEGQHAVEEAGPTLARSLSEKIEVWQGDITTLKVDVIVNAANNRLLGGSGVDGAIHRAAGRELYEECKTLNGCETGKAKMTKGYNLPASHVIHTVGPIYGEGEVESSAKLLESCYGVSLRLAVERGLKSIAFPSISTGVYGYPIEDATRIAIKTTLEFLESTEGPKLDKVIFCVFSDEDKRVYKLEYLDGLGTRDDAPSHAAEAEVEVAAGAERSVVQETDAQTAAEVTREGSIPVKDKDDDPTQVS